MREAQTFQQQYQAALEDRSRAAQLDHEADLASRSQVQRISDDVASQARQAGIGSDAAQQYGALYGARFEARAARLGAEPLDLYRDENLRIVADLPDSIKTLPADGLDAMLGAIRSGRKPPSDADLNGPSLAEFLARRGGVLDQGGELSGIGADAWHRGQPGMPRLVRPALEDRGEALPGMGTSDTLSSEYGLDGAAQAAWERGYLPGADNPGPPALMDALRREMGGEKVYSDREGNPQARQQQAALGDLRDGLDRMGLDPRVHSNAEIRAALASGDAPARPGRLGLNRRDRARAAPATEPDAVGGLSTEGEQPPRSSQVEPKAAVVDTITRDKLEAASSTGDAARPGELSADGMADAFHRPIADAVARGDQVVHIAGDGRETPLTSRDGRTVQAKDGAGVGWMGMLSNKTDRVEIRRGEPAPGRGYDQTAGREPVAKITGEEIAPRSMDLKGLRAAARDFFANTLRGTSVRSDALGRDVEFRGSRKPFNTSANLDKLRLFAALPDIIRHGELISSEAPRTPKRNSGKLGDLARGPVSAVSGRLNIINAELAVDPQALTCFIRRAEIEKAVVVLVQALNAEAADLEIGALAGVKVGQQRNVQRLGRR